MKQQFSVKKFCIEQLERSEKSIALNIEAARYKLGILRQYNNSVKNTIDKERLVVQAKESERKSNRN